jgi:3-oxoadipate enol-lactonase
MPDVTINGIRLHYEEYGPATGLPVILLHAFPVRGALWQAQALALATEIGGHVIVPDLRGFGASEAPAGPYPMDLLARDVLALADHANAPRFVLGGLSMGGYIAFAVVRLAGDRLRGLILADTRAGADNDEGRAERESLAQLAEREGADAVADLMLPRLLSAAGLMNADLAGTVRGWITANQPAGIAGASRGMALRPDATDLLGQIACPTLVICGDQDTTTPVHEARAMFAALPNATLEVVTNAAHLSNLEAPEAFNTALVHFARGLA